MIKSSSTNITNQKALRRGEAIKGQAPEVNNRLQEQVTLLREQVGKIVKQAEERSRNRQANISAEVENACKILQGVKTIQVQGRQ